MKYCLRLSLPPLDRIRPDSPMAFALFDRHGRIVRSGELSLEQLSDAVPVDHVQAILHPQDATAVSVKLPPLPAKRLYEAVQASVEPMALNDTADLCIAHGPRDADGNVTIAWTHRQTMLDAWKTLADAGLKLAAIVPCELALPASDPQRDQPLALPVDARWQTILPKWSLAQAAWRPTSTSRRWRTAAIWAGAAALLWLVGLNLYAARLHREAQTLQASTEHALRSAFPAMGIVIDPVRQAQGQRDRLRLANGTAGQDDFMPLALGASTVMTFAEGHVATLTYEPGILTLVLAEGYTPPGNEAALHQAAAVQFMTLEKDTHAAHTWRFRRADPQTASKGRP